MTTKKKKSAKEKRVLIASIIVAATIVAGSTFAWFSSKDEVTNRLSATADYGVSITEDFTPPKDWLPGQEINKDVSVVNTGNVHAFVRTWLEGELNILSRDAEGTALTAAEDAVDAEDVTDPQLRKARLVPTAEGATTYLRVLDNSESDDPDDYNEVQSLQAGGWLAYAPAGCEWRYEIPGLDDVTYFTATGDGDETNTVAEGTYGCEINSATFQPKTTGLYLFRRSIKLDDDGSANAVGYSGYYYVEGTGYGDGTYYALNTFAESDPGTPKNVTNSVYAGIVLNDGEYYILYTPNSATRAEDADVTAGGEAVLSETSTFDKLAAADVANVKLFLAEKKLLSGDDLTWTYTPAYGEGEQATTVVGKSFVVTADDLGTDNFKIIVNLVNDNVVDAGGTADKWQLIENTFYYTSDLESGATSAQLVDSVALGADVTDADYIAFDFDLNVKMDSIQVTYAGEAESIEPVSENWAVVNGDSATEAHVSDATYEGNEIAALTWE